MKKTQTPNPCAKCHIPMNDGCYCMNCKKIQKWKKSKVKKEMNKSKNNFPKGVDKSVGV